MWAPNKAAWLKGENYETEEIACWRNTDRERPPSLGPWAWNQKRALKSATGLLEAQSGYLQTRHLGRGRHGPFSHLCDVLMLPVCHIHFLCSVLTQHLKLQQLKYYRGTHPSLSKNHRITGKKHPQPQDVSACSNFLLFLYFCFVLLFFYHFDDIRSYQQVTGKLSTGKGQNNPVVFLTSISS